MEPGVHLHWIPLGAGAHVVRLSGKLYEGLSALIQRRRPCDLYHSALEVVVPEGRFVVEVTPVPDGAGDRRGVVGQGAVGLGPLGRLRIFRYEVRRWREGVIPDVGDAVSTTRVVDDLAAARRILELVPSVPMPVWGLDELHAGEMWNSNSVTSWLLATGGVDVAALPLPPGGRAPGWDAGIVVAGRQDGASPRTAQARATRPMEPSAAIGSEARTRSRSSSRRAGESDAA